MAGELAMVPAMQTALKAPRLSEKMATSHGRALTDSLEALGENNTDDAVALLLNCTTKEFWGAGPMRSIALRTKTRESVIMLRILALVARAKAEPELALPALEQLAALYPDISPGSKPTDEYEFEDGIGYTIGECIWKVRKNAGLPTGMHPLELYRGESFEDRGDQLPPQPVE